MSNNDWTGTSKPRSVRYGSPTGTYYDKSIEVVLTTYIQLVLTTFNKIVLAAILLVHDLPMNALTPKKGGGLSDSVVHFWRGPL